MTANAETEEAIQSEIERYCALDFHLNLYSRSLYKQNGMYIPRQLNDNVFFFYYFPLFMQYFSSGEITSGGIRWRSSSCI